jgi:hypothetical protein
MPMARSWWREFLDTFWRGPEEATALVSIEGSTEWCEITRWGGREPGEIPRGVLEAMGIDCSPLDKRDAYGKQGTVWFTKDQADAIRRHPQFQRVEP